MPVKNAAPFLHDCLQSILAQDYTNWELIAVNDHSTDISEKILSEYAAKDSRIAYHNNKGKGIIEALRLAFENAEGEFMTRMDADDLMTPNKLSKMSSQLKDYGHGHLALGQVKYFSENELGDGYKKYAAWLNGLIKTGDNWKDLFKECVIPSPCWMVHRYDLKKAGAFDSNLWPEDYDLCFRFYLSGLKCIPSDQVLHHWRDYSTRTSRNDPHYADNRFLDLKCEYFFRFHPRKDQELVLWGAGKKGKEIAKKIIDQKLDFTWLSNNENKIARDIYGIIVQDQKQISGIKNPCIIIAIANPKEQEEVEKKLMAMKLIKGMHYHFFS